MSHPFTERFLIASATLIMLVFTATAVAAQDKAPKRIRFERGKTSAAVRGHVNGFDTQDYVVGAGAGQQMDIRLKATNSSTYFVLYSINGKPTDMNETDHHSLTTSESGDYVIRVFMMRSAARRKDAASDFTLTISIR